MSEDYIFLTYKGNQEKIDIPLNFNDLKNSFLEKFKEAPSKKFKFIYMNEEEEHYLEDDDFSDKIRDIKNGDNSILVQEEGIESVKQSINFSKNFKKPEENDYKRQNCIKVSTNLNTVQEIIEKDYDEKNNDNNFIDKFNYYENKYIKDGKNINDSCISSDNNKEKEYIKKNSETISKEIENNSLELKEKQKEIDNLNKIIKELKEAENKKEAKLKDISKALEEEKNKNSNNISILNQKIKELNEKLIKEQNEKTKLVKDKNELDSKYKSLENKFNDSQLLIQKNQKKENKEIEQLKLKNDQLIKDLQHLKNGQSEGDSDNLKLKQENKELKEKMEKLKTKKNEEIKEKKNKIKDLEEQLKNIKDNQNNSMTSLNLQNNNSDNSNTNNGNLSLKMNTVIGNKNLSENLMIRQMQKNKRKQNKLEFINKKIKERLEQKTKLNLLDIKKIEKEERSYNENIKYSNQNLIINSNNAQIEKKIKINPKQNEEIVGLKKQLEEKDNQLVKEKELKKNLEIKIKEIEESNKAEKEKAALNAFEKEKSEFQNRINEIETQLKEKTNIINEEKKKLENSEKTKKEFEKNLQNIKEILAQKEDKIKILNNEKQSNINIIRQYEDQIEMYKSDLTKSQKLNLEKNTEQKKEMEQKMKEYQLALENKYKKEYEQKMKGALDDMNKKILQKEESIKKTLDNKYENMKNNYDKKINEMSNLILQNKNNDKKCKTVHKGIKCFKCLKSPIEGFRYKCTQCGDYNLCEKCEDENMENQFHPHLFIKMKNHDPNYRINFYKNDNLENKNNYDNNINKINNNINNNLNNNRDNININNNNNNNNDDFRIIHFGKDEKKYNFECLNRKILIYVIEEGTDKFNIEIYLKNNGDIKWPVNKAKLIFNKNRNLTGKEIILDPLEKGEEMNYKIDFEDLKSYPAGDYDAAVFFEVNGEKYGDEIKINIIIKEKEKEEHLKEIEEFRDLYGLSIEEYPNEKVLKALKENNFDSGKTFESFFN